ncbi:hypothetical protein GWI33_021970, partial [Rhynchophorus ferrugineus]
TSIITTSEQKYINIWKSKCIKIVRVTTEKKFELLFEVILSLNFSII